MKYPFRIVLLVVLIRMKKVEGFNCIIYNVNIDVLGKKITRSVLPVRNGERDIRSMTKHFKYKRLSERHLRLIRKLRHSG